MKKNGSIRAGGLPVLIKLLLMIKLVIFLILTTSFQAFAFNGFTQRRINLKVENQSITYILKSIESKYDYTFFYNDQFGLNSIKMDLTARNATIDQVMKHLLKGTELHYEKVSKGIVVIISDSAIVAPIPIQGRVFDEKGAALAGVSIIEKGTTNGTTTAEDGAFSLSVASVDAILEVSSTGFLSQEVSVQDNNYKNIVLIRAASKLDEVVVVGYGTQRKKDLTGAVGSVSAEQIEKIPVAKIDEAIQGRVAGVLVTNDDGSPGSTVSFQIRGTGTFGNNSPLYVVDGYPVTQSAIASLDPSDVATIDILKDASSTAIYGNRASNGVVIITTKRGINSGLRVSVNGSFSVQSKPPKYNLMNARQFVEMAQLVGQEYNYPVLPEWQGDPSGLRSIDWQDVFYQTGIQQDYNVALRGGNEKLKTSFSLGYYNREGNIIFSQFKRYTLLLNMDYLPAKWLAAGVNVKYAHSNRAVRYGSGVNGLNNLALQIPTMTGNPVTDEVMDKDGNFGFYTKNAQPTTGMPNIYADAYEQELSNPTENLLTSAYIQVAPVKDVKVKTHFGVNTDNGNFLSFRPSNNRVNTPFLASLSRASTNTLNWLWENTVNYNHTFGSIHVIDFVAGISAQKEIYKTVGVRGTGLTTNDIRNVAALQQGMVYTGYQQAWTLSSQFGRLNYRLKDRYLLTGTVRRDGSSRFGPGHQWGVFPSVSGAWILSKESFLANSKLINDLKIRGSWGQAGNQNIALFQYLGTYTQGPSVDNNVGYNFGPNGGKAFYPGFVLNNLPDPSISWETTNQTDIGMDISFMDGRLNFTVDFYNRLSKGFLLNIPVPAQTGFTSATRNVGSIRNRGVELSVEYKKTDNIFKWNVIGNVTLQQNRIMSLTDGLDEIGNFSTLNFRNYGGNMWTVYSKSRVGGVIGAFYGFKTDGIFQAQKEIDELNQKAVGLYGAGAHYQKALTAPGDRKFVDIDHNGIITDADRTIIGSPIPKIFGGLSFNGSYKQWDLSLYFYGVAGNKILNYMKRNLQNFDKADGVGLQNFGVDYYKNHWTPENHSTVYPRITAYDANGNNQVSDVFVEDGSYLRAKNLQIGYTLRNDLINRLRISGVRVYVSAQNLFTITAYSGLDPEVGNANAGDVTSLGVDAGKFPTSRFYTLGLNVNF